MPFLEPERFFSRLSRIDIDKDILACGYENILLDIDNTLLTRDTHEVPRDIALWLGRARDKGINFCLLTNNWHEGVHELAKRLDLPIVSHAIKPLPPAYFMALRKLKAKRGNTLAIGDQLITDVIGAHCMGIAVYLVCPLVEADLKHTLILRNLEKVLIGHLQPEGNTSSASEKNAQATQKTDESNPLGDKEALCQKNS